MDLEEKFESLSLAPSEPIERYIIKTGRELYIALSNTSRIDEFNVLGDAIGQYTLLCSVYGEKTGRIPESLGVDLNEAVHFKINAISDNDAELYDKFISQFHSSLDKVSSKLFDKISAEL